MIKEDNTIENGLAQTFHANRNPIANEYMTRCSKLSAVKHTN